MKFRNLKAEEIDVRIGSCGSGWVTLLPYKDARVDMAILDETEGIGPAKWQRKHYSVKDNMYCSVGIKIGDEWVWKDDCGAESFTEKEKGEASDSFKRACVNWGIGRELYTVGDIFVNCETSKNPKGSLVPTNLKEFRVERIETTDDKIIKTIVISAYNKETKKREQVYPEVKRSFVKPVVQAITEPKVLTTMTFEQAQKVKTTKGTELGTLNNEQLILVANAYASKPTSLIKVAADILLNEMNNINETGEQTND